MTDLVAEEMTGEIINDSTYERNLAFEEACNVDFTCTELASGALATAKQSITAADNAYDFLTQNASDTYSLARPRWYAISTT